MDPLKRYLLNNDDVQFIAERVMALYAADKEGFNVETVASTIANGLDACNSLNGGK